MDLNPLANPPIDVDDTTLDPAVLTDPVNGDPRDEPHEVEILHGYEDQLPDPLSQDREFAALEDEDQDQDDEEDEEDADPASFSLEKTAPSGTTTSSSSGGANGSGGGGGHSRKSRNRGLKIGRPLSGLPQRGTNENLKKACNCKNSKCLKLYCECFAAGQYCVPSCHCQTCENNSEHDDTRMNATFATLERNKDAFKPKFAALPVRNLEPAAEGKFTSPTKQPSNPVPLQAFEAMASVSPKRKSADASRDDLSSLAPSNAEIYGNLLHDLLSAEQMKKIGNVLILAAYNAEAEFLKRGHPDDSPKPQGRSHSAPFDVTPPPKKQRRLDPSHEKTPKLTMESLKSIKTSSPAPFSAGSKGKSVATEISSDTSPLHAAQEKAILRELHHCLQRVFDVASKFGAPPSSNQGSLAVFSQEGMRKEKNSMECPADAAFFSEPSPKRLRTEHAEENPQYFDFNATTPLDPSVVSVISYHLTVSWGNPSSSHVYGVAARKVVEEARQHLATMIHADSKTDILLLSGGTEANNLVFHSVVEDYHQRRSKNGSAGPMEANLPLVVTSAIEHDSVLLPLRRLCQQGRIALRELEPCDLGFVRPSDLQDALTPETILVSIMLANNETAVIQPVAEYSEVIRKFEGLHGCKILLHTDAAQALGKIYVDVEQLGVDYLTIVGHKFYGPRIGALFARNLGKPTSAPLHPIFLGGGQEKNYRSGTENTAMIAGLGEAARLVTANLATYSAAMRLARDLFESLLETELGKSGVHFNGRYEGSVDRRLPNTSNFSALGDGLEGFRILNEASGFVASLGAACHSGNDNSASPILLKSGIPEEVALNAVRFSLGRESTPDGVRKVVREIVDIVRLLQRDKK